MSADIYLSETNLPTKNHPKEPKEKTCRSAGFVFMHEQEALIYLMFVCITLTNFIYLDYLLFIDLCKHWPHTHYQYVCTSASAVMDSD